MPLPKKPPPLTSPPRPSDKAPPLSRRFLFALLSIGHRGTKSAQKTGLTPSVATMHRTPRSRVSAPPELENVEPPMTDLDTASSEIDRSDLHCGFPMIDSELVQLFTMGLNSLGSSQDSQSVQQAGKLIKSF
ncbi:MAG: hypothetical protein Q9177_002929 [Variospora cf. flavescens]